MSVNFQSIQAIDTDPHTGDTIVRISRQELVANWRCAAKLARKEGMTQTAERLEHDADTFARLDRFVVDVGHALLPKNHDRHVKWLRQQYAMSESEAQLEARRRYVEFDDWARWNR